MAIFSTSGLTIQTQEEVLADLRLRFKAKYGDTCRVDDVDGVLGRLAAILAEAKSDTLNDLAATVAGLLPSTSIGTLLEELVKFNGIERNVASKSTVALTVYSNAAGCTIPEGSIVATVTGVQFETDIAVVVPPSDSRTVTATAIEDGALEAPAGTLTEIVTPVFGWVSVTNLSDAVTGNARETDPALRARRWEAAKAVGLHHPSAIRKALLDINGVTAVLLEVNNGTVTNENGVPPQHVRAIVQGGADQDIGDSLFGPGAGSVGAGIGTWGDEEVLCEDTETGQTGTIYFDRAIPVPIYVTIQTVKNRAFYPADGDLLMKQAVVDFSEGNLEINDVLVTPFGLGDDVVSSRLYTAANAVPGHSVRAILISTTPNPTSDDDIAISNHQIATFDVDDVDIEFVT
ncbi:MAG TPA: baseplate J/gp47 family protein [Candidatus Paceibacterota bacterium]|nr:baseplate J/gp47 family protein [Candidatus Paceibacterota bacterium]